MSEVLAQSGADQQTLLRLAYIASLGVLTADQYANVMTRVNGSELPGFGAGTGTGFMAEGMQAAATHQTENELREAQAKERVGFYL